MAAYTTIDNPELYFQCKIFTGNPDDGDHAVTLDGSEDMQPDLVWGKCRDVTYNHELYDSARGATKRIKANATSAEDTNAEYLKSFDSDGFTLGNACNFNYELGDLEVVWCWKESATAGFDIVKFEGTGSAHTEAHSLSAVPHFIIFKGLEVADNWDTFHTALGPEVFPYINSTALPADQTAFMNDTAPTSSVFTVGDATSINTDDKDTIAYCWTAKQGFSKFGTYEGNNDADGTFVYTGFRPRWVMLKNVGATEPWLLLDTIRDSNGNPTNAQLEANDPGAESTNAARNTDFLSNGFKLRYANAALNSEETFIYAAFAEAPFVNSSGVPVNAR